MTGALPDDNEPDPDSGEMMDVISGGVSSDGRGQPSPDPETERLGMAGRLTTAASRLDELADTADLMGDAAAAAGFRDRASEVRMAAMKLLD